MERLAVIHVLDFIGCNLADIACVNWSDRFSSFLDGLVRKAAPERTSPKKVSTMALSLGRSALILGSLALVGPFAIDMYLPAMPEIAQDFGVGETAIQATITSYFMAFGLAQMVYGPWADQSGRKLPIAVGLVIFLIGTAGAIFAATATELTAWRFVQGLGGAVLMVLPRAIIRDMYTGPTATKLMALIMLVISVSPMLAPLAGSMVIAYSGWRTIFVVIFVGALASTAMTMFVLPETLAKENRTPFKPRKLLVDMRTLMTDRNFLGLTFIGAFGMASFFVFIASAAFVYTNQYGLTPTGFSLAFAVNAIGFFSASQVAGPLAERLELAPAIRLGTAMFAGCSLTLLVIALTTNVALPVVVVFLFLANAGLGLVIPTTMVMALEEHGEIAGLASSLGGTLQMLTGGVMIVAAGPIFDGTVGPMVAVIAFCGVVAFALTFTTRTGQDQQPTA
jgi:DHA1 family bicyclomycin/chloramphenicol resistance-like MFS transporter